jgi:hypothetical protein
MVCFWVFQRRKVDDTVISRISCDYKKNLKILQGVG